MRISDSNKVIFLILIQLGFASCNVPVVRKVDFSFVLKDASWVDPRERTLKRGTLIIRDGKVAKALKDSDFTEPADGISIISLKGKYLLPGLIDLHSHTWGNSSPLKDGPDENWGTKATLIRALYCGVVAVLDLGSKETEILNLRNQSKRGEIAGAKLFAVGPVFGYGQPRPGGEWLPWNAKSH
ncbi:MAG: hypothetical protein AABZ55_03515 [Bdellovibrionota bacterium]